MRFLPVGPFMVICNSFGYLFNVRLLSDVDVPFLQVLELSASYTPELSNYKVFGPYLSQFLLEVDQR